MKNLKLTTAITALNAFILPVAFDGGKAGWKLDTDGKLVLENGNPVYVNTAGEEQSVDAATISRLNGEAKSHRENAETAKAEIVKLKAVVDKFKDIDPVKAAEALKTLDKIDKKKLIDAGEVDKVKAEIEKAFLGQIAERDKTIADLTSSHNKLTVSTAFGASEYIKEKIGVPLDMFQAQFGPNFKIEDGVIVPYETSGNKIFSKDRMGEVANFDEALEIMVEQYPNKDSVLKSGGHSGSGNNGAGGGAGGSGKMSRSDFEKLTPVKQSEVATKGEIEIVD